MLIRSRSRVTITASPSDRSAPRGSPSCQSFREANHASASAGSSPGPGSTALDRSDREGSGACIDVPFGASAVDWQPARSTPSSVRIAVPPRMIFVSPITKPRPGALAGPDGMSSLCASQPLENSLESSEPALDRPPGGATRDTFPLSPDLPPSPAGATGATVLRSRPRDLPACRWRSCLGRVHSSRVPDEPRAGRYGKQKK